MGVSVRAPRGLALGPHGDGVPWRCAGTGCLLQRRPQSPGSRRLSGSPVQRPSAPVNRGAILPQWGHLHRDIGTSRHQEMALLPTHLVSWSSVPGADLRKRDVLARFAHLGSLGIRPGAPREQDTEGQMPAGAERGGGEREGPEPGWAFHRASARGRRTCRGICWV